MGAEQAPASHAADALVRALALAQPQAHVAAHVLARVAGALRSGPAGKWGGWVVRRVGCCCCSVLRKDHVCLQRVLS